MSAAKTAAVSLIALMLLSSPTSGPRQSESFGPADQSAMAARADLSIALIPLARLPRSSSIAAFAPWRHRLKTVLEETSSKVVDQFDLGPADPRTAFCCCPSVELIDHRKSTATPLRC